MAIVLRDRRTQADTSIGVACGRICNVGVMKAMTLAFSP
jgi:hypothetical protein